MAKFKKSDIIVRKSDKEEFVILSLSFTYDVFTSKTKEYYELDKNYNVFFSCFGLVEDVDNECVLKNSVRANPIIKEEDDECEHRECVDLRNPECDHNWVNYVGLFECFTYCTKCDQRKPNGNLG